MLALERTFSEVRIWGRDPLKAQACADDLGKSRSIPACNFAVTESVKDAVEGADVVITVTASREPLVRAAWLKPGVTVIAVGSDGPDKQELDVDVLARADKIVADSIAQCLRLGEIHHAVERGAITKEKIYAELGEITAGTQAGPNFRRRNYRLRPHRRRSAGCSRSLACPGTRESRRHRRKNFR